MARTQYGNRGAWRTCSSGHISTPAGHKIGATTSRCNECSGAIEGTGHKDAIDVEQKMDLYDEEDENEEEAAEEEEAEDEDEEEEEETLDEDTMDTDPPTPVMIQTAPTNTGSTPTKGANAKVSPTTNTAKGTESTATKAVVALKRGTKRKRSDEDEDKDEEMAPPAKHMRPTKGQKEV
ncbi:hypothetical protein M408DRAFT_12323 [Serendipita vermifera MAFF 305830]|uniref:Uncharacterized protein n=1 Tax=Serendipita vermifera MAFF 305830 TaxID=933852 RepID=A0A0C2W617_SERVB|nr:hypothetical protein M408DRAFT_12323 [Serendipita vermifera MAFF 305830]